MSPYFERILETVKGRRMQTKSRKEFRIFSMREKLGKKGSRDLKMADFVDAFFL
jgi:hypothetical protein